LKNTPQTSIERKQSNQRMVTEYCGTSKKTLEMEAEMKRTMIGKYALVLVG